jgi:GTP-binding protein HflX
MTDNNTISRPKAVLAGLSMPGRPEDSTEETLDELEALLDTAGGDCAARALQRRDAPDARTFLGGGKAAELAQAAESLGAEMLIIDHELSPSQARRLEEATGLRVLDRSQLILDIFAGRAQSREGRVQVELAQLRYLLPRLTGRGISMSRLGGGIGTRGPGESQLETDRRHIRRRIDKLEADLADIRRARDTQRLRRTKAHVPEVALIGYTNAGKSTLLGTLAKTEVSANDRLFDTLDPITRRWRLEEGKTVLLSDTVGFIRKLPHHLIEAFRATLEELRHADLLLHVIDLSAPDWEEQANIAEELIRTLEAAAPVLRVYNKRDRAPAWEGRSAEGEPSVWVSARTGEGLDELRDKALALLF